MIRTLAAVAAGAGTGLVIGSAAIAFSPAVPTPDAPLVTAGLGLLAGAIGVLEYDLARGEPA